MFLGGHLGDFFSHLLGGSANYREIFMVEFERIDDLTIFIMIN